MRFIYFFLIGAFLNMVGVFEEWKLKFNFSLDGRGVLRFNYHAAWIPDG